jgi:DNA (cytosine-5)-methyltransferase 1
MLQEAFLKNTTAGKLLHVIQYITFVNEPETMKHGSLFSGIGGFDLAAQWAGWENVFHCEINEFGRKVLKYYWPEAISYEDITATDFTIHRGQIDILTGGFPCQPYSLAGKRKGTEDDRHLWPEMLRAVREIQPSWIVGENVCGLVNWSGGLVFEEVQADLEAEGYEVQPVILPACAKNAPHRRDRIWFIAYANKVRSRGRGTESNREEKDEGERSNIFQQVNGYGLQRITADTEISHQQRNRIFKEQQERKARGCNSKAAWFEEFPTQSPICSRNDGFSSQLSGITFPKWRNESIKAYGNAIVPQIAYEIFKAINLMNERKPATKKI